MSVNSFWPTEAVQDQVNIRKFRKRLMDFHKHYQSSKKQLLDTYLVLLSGQEILPDECDGTLDILDDLSNLIKDIDELLNTRNPLPIIDSSKYGVLFHVYRANELSNDLTSLVQTFRRICLEERPETFRLRQTVVRKMEKLVQTVENIEPESKILLKGIAANKLS